MNIVEQYNITAYELKVANLYATGLTNKEVASILKKCQTAPHNTITRLRKRMGCKNTIHLFITLAKNNLI